MGVSFSEAVKNELVSEETLKVIPKRCLCGSELEFSDSLKELKCTDKNCKQTVIARVCTFCKKLGIPLSYEDASYIVNNIGIVTPYQIMMLDELNKENSSLLGMVFNIDEVLQVIENIKQNEYLLNYVVELCGIEDIANIAEKMFYGFKSLDEAYNEIEIGQVTFVNERLGIKKPDSSIISVRIYNELLDSKEELLFGETQFKIKEYDSPRLNIAFCDNTIPFINKSELIEEWNYKYGCIFNQVTIIGENTDILVKNVDGASSKIRAARTINDEYTAELMNNTGMELRDIGKYEEGKLKPIGSKVFVESLANIESRLQYMIDKGYTIKS